MANSDPTLILTLTLNMTPNQVMLPNVKVAAPGVQQAKNKIKAEKKAAATQKKANKAAAAELD